MQAVPSNLRIELVWADADMIELQLAAASDAFEGRVNFYAGLDDLAELAARLEKFPTSADDVRTFDFGQDNLPGYGKASLRFYARDASGHLVVQISMSSTPGEPKCVEQSAVVQVDAVPADIDSFIEQLRGMGTNLGATAVLIDAT